MLIQSFIHYVNLIINDYRDLTTADELTASEAVQYLESTSFSGLSPPSLSQPAFINCDLEVGDLEGLISSPASCKYSRGDGMEKCMKCNFPKGAEKTVSRPLWPSWRGVQEVLWVITRLCFFIDQNITDLIILW